ncbi:MAG: hypothetical protein ABFC24_05555 [Methanoregulaceae archaeon]
MASRKKKSVTRCRDPAGYRADLLEMLDRALESRMDFVVAFEACEPGAPSRMHAMTGRLVTPCMLGTLRNRMELQEDEGAEYRICNVKKP